VSLSNPVALEGIDHRILIGEGEREELSEKRRFHCPGYSGDWDS
jgi:hypothetical protein